MDNLRNMLEMQITRPSISFKSKQQQTYNAGFEIIPRDALQIAEVLGKGQFGEVKKAFLSENVIAVKELHQKNMDESSSFVKELLTMIQLGYHPNILRVFGAVTENLIAGNLMICMEYCEEGSLRQLIKRERDKYADERTDIDQYYTQTIHTDVWDQILEGKRNLGYNLATR